MVAQYIASDTTDGVGLPAGNITIGYDNTGATAGAIGHYIKLISKTMQPWSSTRYTDTMAWQYTIWDWWM
jgi:hypothetical protein